MELFILVVFILGYLAITLEHNLKIDKLIPALMMMALAWAGLAFGLDSFTTWFDSHDSALLDITNKDHEWRLHAMESTLLHHFGKTSEILIFLIGAMTIVEIIDFFDGFATIKKFIKTNKKKTLLWIVCSLAFILSAIIDNLTATIVLITILRKLLKDSKQRIWFAGLIIIAANAGGAWSPIGDITTTMLWMGKKVTTLKLIEFLILPSLVCMVIPTVIASFLPAFKGDFEPTETSRETNKYGPRMLYLGLTMIVMVPVFKTVTHLPPYVGMMLSLAVVSLTAEFISSRKFSQAKLGENSIVDDALEVPETHTPHDHSPTYRALGRIEMPSILFFLGILMTVAALESLGMVFQFGQTVQDAMPQNVFVMILGGASAVIDNVPLVAASMGMFDMSNPAYATDSAIWHYIAYAAGTGGSMLIIGSAAGVVAMGMEKISFFWYLKNIAWLALVGYLAGAGVFLLFHG